MHRQTSTVPSFVPPLYPPLAQRHQTLNTLNQTLTVLQRELHAVLSRLCKRLLLACDASLVLDCIVGKGYQPLD